MIELRLAFSETHFEIFKVSVLQEAARFTPMGVHSGDVLLLCGSSPCGFAGFDNGKIRDSLKNMENSYGDLSSIKKLVGLILGKVLDLSRQSFFRSFRKRLMT